MKLRVISILAMLAVSLSLLSCIVTSHLINVEISCDQFREHNNQRSEFQMEIGDKLTIKLCSNRTTGFKWQYEMTGDVVLNEEDHDFEEPEEEGIVGAAGIEVWTFEAVETGVTELLMEYSQQGGIQAEWTYTATVTVESLSE